MKRTIIITVVFLLAACGAYIVYAAEESGTMMTKKMMGKSMMDKPMMGMCPMHMMMCQGAMEKKLVALEDGSIVIMTCTKLYKYDKDLNLVKEVELKKISEDVKAKMEEMKKECMEKCPMMKMQEKSSDM
jgi:hypothetical protein